MFVSYSAKLQTGKLTMAIPAYYSLIQKGSYGPDEALVQTWLNGVRDQCSYYPALTTDGRFGTRSENAVKEFQLRNNMNMDGKVGANTWNVLYAKYTAKHGLAVPYPGIVMRTGMSGGTIRLIQQKLNTLGEKIGTDGKFGSRTAAAVQRFQRRNDARKYMLTDEFRNADHASQDALVSAVQQMERALGGSGKVSFKKLGAEVTAYQKALSDLKEAHISLHGLQLLGHCRLTSHSV